ncbi:Histone-lysine N-methyltransferase [Actinidia chinensis var. chinensis]|uniref:Histone-lysine N-methyltransferase n=1 Tax=Actinidia chinensis var. chinensis TaxID=1590841 RepID=A0A2R6PKE3_ACTCC|nr:Histone-lysine N-methyltransferase [Actinidia chinensis var. chinensis]
MEHNPKVLKAFSAMKDLGIPPKIVKPILKELLKVYYNNWELIEEDNYRTLADAIFEWGEKEQREYKAKVSIECDGSGPPKKKHLEQREAQVSSSTDNKNTVLDLEEDAVPQTSVVQKMIESSQSCVKDGNTEPSFHSLPTVSSNNGKDPISSDLYLKETKSSSKRGSSALYSSQGRDGPCFDPMLKEKKHKDCRSEDFVVPKGKQSVNDVPHSALPTSVVYSALQGTGASSSTGSRSTKHLTSPCVDKQNKEVASACNYGETLLSNFVIASSPSGDVKISLKCNTALRQRNFLTPNLETVLEFLENKYQRSYKIVWSQFSVKKLLDDLCESYLELVYNSNGKSLIRRSSTGNCLPYNTVPNRKVLSIGNSGKELITKGASCSETSNSLHLVVAHQQPTSHDRKRPFRKINDITKGTEKARASLLDEGGNEQLPNFVYIPQNIVYQNAYIHFSLARIADDDCCSSCLGDCLSLPVPCECARDTGGEFAYTSQGLLKEEFLRNRISMNVEPQKHFRFICNDCPLERAKNANNPEPCKGHLHRQFIKECWRKCGCDMQCGNRIVQRGITCKLQVFLTSEGKGWGLRTLQDLPKGAFVCEYVGEVLTNMELYERNNQSSGNERHTYPVLLDADWGSEAVLKDEDALCLDATFYGNLARFINHRCVDANLIDIPVEVETPDHHYYHLAFFTKRKVDALEELTWDYGIDFNDHNHPIKAFQCCCGSAFCQDRRGKGTKSSALRKPTTSRSS